MGEALAGYRMLCPSCVSHRWDGISSMWSA
jgi:hypothetical protein